MALPLPSSDPLRSQLLAIATEAGDLPSFLVLARVYDGVRAAPKTRTVKG